MRSIVKSGQKAASLFQKQQQQQTSSAQDMEESSVASGILSAFGENGGNGQEHYTTATLTGLSGATGLTISVWFSQSLGDNSNSTYNGLFMTRLLTSHFAA